MKNKLLVLLALHLGLAAVVAQPVITSQPQDQTALAGATVTFSVGATGTPPLSYQWRSHLLNTISFTNIPFGTEAMLALTNVQPTTRQFAVVVTDAGGLSATSTPLARLTVLVPISIVMPPSNQAGFVGDNIALGVSATGTTPLSFQWLFNGNPLAGANQSNLVFSSVQLTAAGNYSVVVSNAAGSITSQVVTVTVTPLNVIGEWNDALIPAIRASNLDGYQLARILAMTHLAQFEAVNAVAGRYTSYALSLAAPTASPEAAAAQAAFTILTNTMPANSSSWNAQLTRSLAKVPDGPAKSDGVALGRMVAQEIIKLRATDGAFLTVAEPQPTLVPGVWRPTPPNFFAASGASLPYTTTFTMKSSSQFRPAPPPALTSARYAQDFNEIKDLGSAGATTRTAEQSRIAQYHWYELPHLIAAGTIRALSAQRPTDLAATARIYALLFMSCPDHFTAAWDGKYHYHFWRPITAIRLAATDGNPATTQDANWNSYLETFSSQDYPSGHATGVSACNEILASVYGDDIAFSISTPTLPGNIRSFAHLSDLTQEGQDARVYAGIHYRFATDAAALLGKQLGQHALRNVLVPLPQATSGAVTTNGTFQLTLRSLGPVPYVIETSSDLVSWIPWQTNAFGVLQVIDETAASANRRFYRAVQP